jgi:hypothetical protein
MQNNGIQNFKFWCQKVLPLVFDDSLSYYEVLCKLSSKLNEVINSQNAIVNEMEHFEEVIKNDLIEILNQMLKNGELYLETTYDENTKTLKFIFGGINNGRISNINNNR